MTVISINVGLPQEILREGETVRTSIFKTPVAGRVRVIHDNFDGDRQSDLKVHGGPDKAVYAYPSEHYESWHRELPGVDLPWGSFGENVTTQGLLEDSVRIGDRLKIGTAEFLVTQPRMPCFKLGIRFARPDIIKRFLESGRSGFYLRILKEGDVAAGDAMTHLPGIELSLSIAEIVSLYTSEKGNEELIRRATTLTALPEGWRSYFSKRLANMEKEQ